MNRRIARLVFLFSAALLLQACASISRVDEGGGTGWTGGNRPVRPPVRSIPYEVPAVNREFRGVWVATVDNIDWPSKPGLSTGEQQSEFRRLLNRAVELNLNAVVFQVRPTADAFYDSPFEPWSAYLSGQQGLAPDPYYDPLKFAVEEAHRRGLELHAWFNPYRAYHPTEEDDMSDLHVSKSGLAERYGDQMWMDPGSEEVANHSLQVILDVVDRYDIDGVHLDDYFYPYPVVGDDGEPTPFPDDASWNRRSDPSSGQSKDDWRRANVDRFVHRLYTSVKEHKPWVKVGISPFGIWRPGYPEGISGFDAYEKIYADARKWLQNGWVDYLTPQLYWSVDSDGQSYPRLLDWWIEQNVKERHVWPGNFTSRITLEGDRYWGVDEIIRQIAATRAVSGADGNVHFSMQALMPADHGMGRRLAEEAYQDPAVVPATPWLGNRIPTEPTLEVRSAGNRWNLFFRDPDGASVWLWIVQLHTATGWKTEIVPGWRQSFSIVGDDGSERVDALAVSALSRTGIQGPVAVATLDQSTR